MSEPTEIELVVNAPGTVRCIYDEELDLREIGKFQVTRASRVEPDPDGNWWVDMGPVGGPMLGPSRSRSAALAAERQWLADIYFDDSSRSAPAETCVATP